MHRSAAALLLALLCLLAGCTEGERMRRQLARLEALNDTGTPMTDDALAVSVARYFERHGTPWERLRAYYILGRTHADRGELPAALDAFLDAAEQADTTSADCDYAKLSRVYGQMAGIFYRQNLIAEDLRCSNYAIEYAWKAKDTLQALRESAMRVAAFDMLHQYDSVVTTFSIVYKQLRQFCGEKVASQYSLLPVKSLLANKKMHEAKAYLDDFRAYSGYFNTEGDIESGREVYYYYIGMYYLNTQQRDSAYYFFHKELCDGHDYLNQNMASHGLAMLYGETSHPDSAAKYALYSYDMNDSVYAQMATDEVARMQAAHDYSRHQRIAEQEHRKARQERDEKYILLAILLALLAITSAAILHWRRKRKAIVREFRAKEKELERAKADLANLQMLEKEMAGLQTLKDKLAIQIKEKETYVQELLQAIAQYRRNEQFTRDDTESRLISSPIYQSLQKKSVTCAPLSDGEWAEINTLVRDVLPGFNHFLASLPYHPDSIEYRTCLLFRLHIGVKAAGGFMDVNKSYVSQVSTKILREVFALKGSGKALIHRLESIC